VSRLIGGLQPVAPRPDAGAVLDTMPLVDTLHHAISLPRHRGRLADKGAGCVAVTASSYTSGVHWTFCHSGAGTGPTRPGRRPGRRAEFQPITIEHLMASSAIPFIFPATPLWVDGHREFFGDGSMRQVSPLSPAMHLGAHRIMAIGVGQPERAGLGGRPTRSHTGPRWAASPGMPWPACSTTRCRPTWSRPSA
jgi:NTE family protein